MISMTNNLYNTALYQKNDKNKQTSTSNESFIESLSSAKDVSLSISTKGDSAPLFSVGYFLTGNSFSVYRADDYTEDNPSYLVAGKEKGEDFEVTINANDVKSNKASLIEMAALQVHLKEKGLINNIELHPYEVDQDNYPAERSLFEKLDVISGYKKMYINNLSNSRYDHLINLGKIIAAFKTLK